MKYFSIPQTCVRWFFRTNGFLDMQLSKQEKKEFIRKIGERIRELRLESKLSQSELSTDAYLSKNQLGRLERGEHIPNIITLLKLAAALNVRISEIVDLKKM